MKKGNTSTGNLNDVKLWQFTAASVCTFKLGHAPLAYAADISLIQQNE
jgi:hypothetical protein